MPAPNSPKTAVSRMRQPGSAHFSRGSKAFDVGALLEQACDECSKAKLDEVLAWAGSHPRTGIELNKPLPSGNYPLEVAIAAQRSTATREQFVALLLGHGANPDLSSKWRVPFGRKPTVDEDERATLTMRYFFAKARSLRDWFSDATTARLTMMAEKSDIVGTGLPWGDFLILFLPHGTL